MFLSSFVLFPLHSPNDPIFLKGLCHHLSSCQNVRKEYSCRKILRGPAPRTTQPAF
jgi:hypothetical protein